MKELVLSKGYKAIVDDEDFEFVNQFKWHVILRGKKPYAERTQRYGSRKLNKKMHFKLHRVLVNCPKDKVVDHKNGDTLDNRRSNLRICTSAENSRNHSGQPALRKYSSYKGVKKNGNSKTWTARITYNGKCLYLGSYDTDKEAAIAYNKAALKYFNNFAKLNKI